MALGIISGIITSRGLGVEDRGTLVSLLVWSALIGSLALAGMDEAIIFQANGSAPRARELGRAVARQALAQTVVGTCVLIGIAYYLIEPDSFSSWLVVLATALVVPLNTLNLLAVAPLRAGRRFRAWQTVRLVQPVLYAAGTALLWASGYLSVLSALVVQLAGGVAAQAWLRNLNGNRRLSRLDPDTRRRVSAYGHRLLAASLPQRVGPKLDQLMISIFMTPAALGIYSVATAITAVVLMIGTSLDQVLFPRYSAQEYGRETVLRATLLGMIFGAGVAGLILVGAEPLIRLAYGREFEEAASPLVFLLTAAVFRIGSQSIGAAAKASGQLRTYTFAQALGLTLLAASFVILVPYGVIGASIASLIGALATFAVLMMRVRTMSYASLSRDLTEETK
jgi:O-antigen/teichoic acid export membrane protein